MRKKQPYLFILIAFIMIMTGIPTSASGAEDYTWSDWSTNNPGGGYDYESKTQYRYADKQFIKSGYPSVSGYTRSSKNLISTTYSNWTSNKLSGSTSQNSSYTTEKTVETKSAYWSYAYVCDCMKFFWCNDKGAHKHSDGKKHYTVNRLNIYSSKSLSASGHPGEWQDGVYGYKCAQDYYRGSTHKIGYVYCLSYKGKFVDQYSSKTWTWLWQANQKKTVYRTVTKKYDYTHWKWGSYSNWSDSYVASNSNRNVQTRTLYRYKIYPKAQTINVDSTEYNKTYGDAPFNLGASASTSLSYESSDPSVASVSSNGTVTIKKSGNAAITIRAAKSIYYKAASKEVTINVAKAGQKIKLNEFFDCDILEHICTPESYRLGAKAKTGLSYSSSNSNVVSVSSNGTVRFKNPGKAKITIRAKSTSKYKSAVRKIAVECVLEKPTMAKAKQNGKIYMSVAFGSYAADTHYIQFKNKDNTGEKSLLKIVEKKENGRPMYYGYKNQNGTWKYKVKSRILKKISVKVTKKGYYRAVATKKGYSSYTNWVKVN